MPPSSYPPMIQRCRIVLTGGPGGGKTTAGDIFRRELGDRVALVPEAATLLFSANFPRSNEPKAIRATQQAIFHVQRSLEDVQAATHPGRILLCDRGTIDGAAYWPEGPVGFFDELRTTLEAEFERYDGVVFFESSATAGYEVDRINVARTETTSEAASLDKRLFDLWSRHPRFSHVPNSASFFKKIGAGFEALNRMVASINGAAVT